MQILDIKYAKWSCSSTLCSSHPISHHITSSPVPQSDTPGQPITCPEFGHECTSLNFLLEFPAPTSIWRGWRQGSIWRGWQGKAAGVTILVTAPHCLFGERAEKSRAVVTPHCTLGKPLQGTKEPLCGVFSCWF